MCFMTVMFVEFLVIFTKSTIIWSNLPRVDDKKQMDSIQRIRLDHLSNGVKEKYVVNISAVGLNDYFNEMLMLLGKKLG